VTTERVLSSHRAAYGGGRPPCGAASDWAERLFALAVDPLAVVGYDGYLKRVNPVWQRLFGWRPEELLSRPYLEFVHPDDRAETTREVEALRGDTPPRRDLELRFRARDGSHRWLSVSAQKSPEEQVIYAVAKDVTARKRTEQALRHSEERFRSVVSALDEGIVLIDADGVIQASNGAAERILGVSSEEIARRSSMDPRWRMVREDGSPFPGDEIPAMRTLRTGRPVSHVVMGVHKPDGTLSWISINAHPLASPGDRSPRAVVCSFTDITHRKRAEDALREAEERFRTAFDAAPIGMTLSRLDGGYLRVNPALCDLLGYDADELQRRDFRSVSHPDDIPLQEEQNQRLLAGQAGSYEIEKRFVRADGRLVWALLTCSLVRDAEGEPRLFVIQVVDITRRKEAEAALRVSEERFRSIAESATEAMVVADPNGRIVSWNSGAVGMFGYETEDVVGRPLTALMPERFRARHNAGLERVRETGEGRLLGQTIELVGQRREGTEFPIELSLSSWMVHGERFYGGIARDITERKRAEAELERSNADLAQFASVASHDLREPLVVVKGYLELLSQRHSDSLDADGRRFLGFAVDGVDRMQELISDLLEWSRAGAELDRLPVDPRVLAEQAAAAVEHRARTRRVTVEIGELPAVRAEPTALRRVFQNLISNAVKFGAADEPRVSLAARREASAWRFTVADNGPGIAERDRDRVFTLFERLGARQRGTGIGLAICRRIVERHGGRIWVEESPGGGAAFHFTIED
jgi:PAS domain S-box-containing protein